MVRPKKPYPVKRRRTKGTTNISFVSDGAMRSKNLEERSLRKQTFLLDPRRLRRYLLAKRAPAAMNKEKRLFSQTTRNAKQP